LERLKKNRDKRKEKLVRQDEIDIIAVEGKFGNGKRADTSESSIAMIILECVLRSRLFNLPACPLLTSIW